MNDASLSPPPSRGVSMTALILTAALTAMTAVAVVLAVLYFSGGGGRFGAPGQPSVLAALTGTALTPNVQKDTVKPQGKPAGEVFYELPFASPPHLALSAPHRVYRIVKQDEYGFSWEVDSIVADFFGDVKDVTLALESGRLDQIARKPNIEYEDFTFEAKGIQAAAGALPPRIVEQNGSFKTAYDQAGEVHFKTPFAQAPNVELSGGNAVVGVTVVQECTSTGFKFKTGRNAAFNGFPFDSGVVNWTARGPKATPAPK